MIAWEEAQREEAEFWGSCVNTFHEEEKQRVYARYMGLPELAFQAHPPTYWSNADTVVDIGGGPVSLLLKTEGPDGKEVVDPCDFPEWVLFRYRDAGIVFTQSPAETFKPRLGGYTEAWIYNCLQHVQDPELVINRAKQVAKIIRLFEWVDVQADLMHPHTLTANDLARWLGDGTTSGHFSLNESGAVGTAYVALWERH